MKSKIQIYHYDFLRIMKKYSIMGMYFSRQSPSKERATRIILGLLSVISIVAAIYLCGSTVGGYIQYGAAILCFIITFCLFLFLRRADLMIKGDYDSPNEKKKDEILAMVIKLEMTFEEVTKTQKDFHELSCSQKKDYASWTIFLGIVAICFTIVVSLNNVTGYLEFLKMSVAILIISAALWNTARLIINQIFNSIPRKYSELSIIFMCIKPDHLAVNTVKKDVNKGSRFLNFISCIFENSYKKNK